MLEIITTDVFDNWFVGLNDRQVRSIVLSRLKRLSLGNPGDDITTAKIIAAQRKD
jgi:putative component of toxin-antitoxin plasmid stabilization module